MVGGYPASERAYYSYGVMNSAGLFYRIVLTTKGCFNVGAGGGIWTLGSNRRQKATIRVS